MNEGKYTSLILEGAYKEAFEEIKNDKGKSFLDKLTQSQKVWIKEILDSFIYLSNTKSSCDPGGF